MIRTENIEALKKSKRGRFIPRCAGLLVFLLTVHSVFSWGDTVPILRSGTENKTAFYLPSALGRVKEVFHGQGSARLILIEDAHVQEEAQRKIGGILDFLAKQYDLRWVYLEGASGELEHRLLSTYPNRRARRLLAERLLTEHVLSGAEYAALRAHPEFRLWGVESPELYAKNRAAYFETAEIRERMDPFLSALEKRIEQLIPLIFSADLRTWVLKKDRFEQEGQLGDYIEFLDQLAERYPLRPSSPLSKDFIALQRVEKEGLSKVVATKEASLKFSIIKKRVSRQAPELFDEITFLENFLRSQLVLSDAEKSLETLRRQLGVIRKISTLSLTAEDADYLQKQKKAFRAENLKERLGGLSRQSHFDDDLVSLDAGGFDLDFKRIRRFYELALQRNEALVGGALAVMADNSVQRAALITGGFHMPGMTRILRENKISYCVITPQFTLKQTEREQSRAYADAMGLRPTTLEIQSERIGLTVDGRVRDPFYQLQTPRRLPYTDSFVMDPLPHTGQSMIMKPNDRAQTLVITCAAVLSALDALMNQQPTTEKPRTELLRGHESDWAQQIYGRFAQARIHEHGAFTSWMTLPWPGAESPVYAAWFGPVINPFIPGRSETRFILPLPAGDLFEFHTFESPWQAQKVLDKLATVKRSEVRVPARPAIEDAFLPRPAAETASVQVRTPVFVTPPERANESAAKTHSRLQFIFPYIPVAADGASFIFSSVVFGYSWGGLASMVGSAFVLRAALTLGIFLHEQGHLTAALAAGFWSSAKMRANWFGGLSFKAWSARLVPLGVSWDVPKIRILDIKPGTWAEKWIQFAAVPLSVFYLLAAFFVLGPWAGWTQGGVFLLGAAVSVAMGALSDSVRKESTQPFCCGVSDEIPAVAGPRVKAGPSSADVGSSWTPYAAVSLMLVSGVGAGTLFFAGVPDGFFFRIALGGAVWLMAVAVRFWGVSVIWPRFKKTWETIRQLDFRGQQAAGIELRGTVRPWLGIFLIKTGGDFPVVIKKLNPKRADLATVLVVDIFLKMIFWSLFLRMHEGTEGIHVRFSTSDPSALATQPRSWVKLNFWNMLFGRRPIVTMRDGRFQLAYHWPGTVVRHNGDLFGYAFKRFKAVLAQGGELHSFLSGILHYTNREGGDTVEVAGLLDLFTTAGDFLASVRLAFLQTVMTAPVKAQMLSQKEEKQIARLFEKVYRQHQAEYQRDLSLWIREKNRDAGEVDLSDSPQVLEDRLAKSFLASLRDTGAKGARIPAGSRKAFADASARAFFRGDMLSAGRALAFDRSKTEHEQDTGDARGTFGLTGGSPRLWRDQFYYSQDQPLSFVFGTVADPVSGKPLLDGKIASTPAVLNLTPRFQSRFDFQDGEILRVRRNSQGHITSISVFSATQRSFLSEQAIAERTFNIEKDPFIERPVDPTPQETVQHSRKRMTEAVDAAWKSLRPEGQTTPAALPGEASAYVPDPFNSEVADSLSRAIRGLHRTASADFAKTAVRVDDQAEKVMLAAQQLQSGSVEDEGSKVLADIVRLSAEIRVEIQTLARRVHPAEGAPGILFEELKKMSAAVEIKTEQVRHLARNYAESNLTEESEKLFSAAEKILYRRGTDILLTGIQDSLDNAQDMALLLRQFFPLLNVEIRESNQLSLTLAQIARGDHAAKVALGLHHRTIAIPLSQSGAFQTAVNTHFLRTQVNEIFALLGGRDNDVARKIGQGRVLSSGTGSFESDQTHIVTNPAMLALAVALVFKTAKDSAEDGTTGGMFTKEEILLLEQDFESRVRDAGYITGFDRTRSPILSSLRSPNASAGLNALGRQIAWDIRETGIVTFIMFVTYALGAQFGLPIFPTSWFQEAFLNAHLPQLSGFVGSGAGFWAAVVLAFSANIAFLYLFGRLVLTRLWRVVLNGLALLTRLVGLEPYIQGRPLADRASAPAYFIHTGYRHIAERLKAVSQIILSLKYPHNSPRTVRAESHAEGVHRDRDGARGDRDVTYVPEAPEQRQLAIMHGNQFVGNLTKMFDFLTGRVSLIEIRHDGSANKRALVSIDLRRPDWMVYTPEKFSSSEAFRAAIEIRDAFNTFDYLLAHNTIWAETARHLWTLGPVVRGMQFLEKVFLLKGGLEFIKLRFPWLFLFSADHRDHSGANQATTQLSPVEVIQDFIAQREAEERSTRGAVPAYRSAFLDLGDARAQRVLGQPLLSYFYDDGTHPQLHQTSISERGRAESDAVVRGGDGGSARRELSLRPRDDDHSVVISGETGLSEGAQNDQGSLNLVWVFEQRISAISALPEVEDQLHALEDLEFVRGVLMTEPSPQGGLEANTRLLLEVGRLISEARRKAIAARSELRLASDLSQALRAKTVTEQTVRVQTELAQLRGLVHQLDQISSGWRDELGAWAEPFARQLGIRTPGHFNASGGFIVDQMNEALIQQALIEAPKGIPVLFYLPPADAENSTAQRLRQRFQTEIADGRFIIPVLSPLETWTLEKFALREALKRGLDISDIYGIRTSEAVYQELGPTLVNRTLAGAVKLAEHRLLVVGGAKTIGQPLYTEFGWDDLLVAALSSVKSMAASA